MLVSLLLWCDGGSCWGTGYCLLQSMFTLFGMFRSGPHYCVSHSRRARKARSWRKRAHKMRRRRKLAYHLVLKCRHRNGLRALDGTKLLVPACRKHKRWKARNAHSRQSYRIRNKHFFKPNTKISNTVLHNWCYGNRDFTQLPCLLRSLKGSQQLNEWKDQCTAQSVVNRLHVFRCSLESTTAPCNHSSSFENTPLVWDTGASLGLTPYRADFIDYLEVNIPVKDVTKTNYVVGIGTVIF